MNLQSKIAYSIALLRKCEQMALDYDPENGFYLAFSGGKDSQALYHLAVMAGKI
jgi:phosphoadenosine phosphosulfate reductase